MIALFVVGCRDLVDDGRRLSDQHILRGRTPPHLLESELRAGWFVSTDAHLVPLETWVRTHLGGSFSLRGLRPDRGIRPDAEGTVTRLSLVNGLLLRTTSTLGGTPFITHNTDALRDEYRILCGRPGWSNLAPAVGPAEDRCNPLSIPGAAGTFIDDVIVTVNSELIEIDWAPPSTTLNPLSDIRGLSASSSAEDRGTCSRGCGPGFSCPPGAPPGSLCELTPVPCAEHRDCADVEGHTGETREAFLQMQTLGLDSPRIPTLGVVSAQCGGAPGDACTPGVTDCGPGRSCACPRGEACDQPRCLASCAARVVTHLGRDASLTAPVLRVRMPPTRMGWRVPRVLEAGLVIEGEARFEPIGGGDALVVRREEIVAGSETVETPAGAFSTWRLEATDTNRLGDAESTYTRTSSWAAGVGVVRQTERAGPRLIYEIELVARGRRR